MRIGLGAALLAVIFTGTACDLDLANPNSPTEESALSDPNGIMALAVAMQGQYASSINSYIRAPALVTDEWGTWSKALASDIALFNGGQIDNSFGTVSGPYYNTYRILRSANNLIEHAPQVGLGTGLETGIVALAKLHKAMALGAIVQQYEQIPVDASVEGAAPQPREVVLDTILSLLESAHQELAGVTDDELDVFRDRVLDPGLDLRSTVDAMIARYSLIAGDDEAALAAAERVPADRISTYSYTGSSRNPVYDYSFELNYVAPLQSFALEAEPGDARVGFWVDTTQVDATVTPTVVHLAQYADPNAPFPVYLPDEMKLIAAEAHARADRLAEARALINEVRTQCSPALEEPAACLPELSETDLPDQASVLAQIAYERRYELYMQGLRWEDLRRLGQYVDRAPKAEYLPLPLSECQINPEAGC